MLASPMPKEPHKAPVLTDGAWAAEEKYDGHRLVVEVADARTQSLYGEGNTVTAWSRYGKERLLPNHIIEALQHFPVGIYDGELLAPGKRSYGVTELVNGAELVYVMFDVLQVTTDGVPTSATDLSYVVRRGWLEEAFKVLGPLYPCIQLAESTVVTSVEQVAQMAEDVWRRDGEGLILKRRLAPYQVGKRSKDFIKIKKLQTAVLTVIGFEAGRGTINYRGEYATVVLRDDAGFTTTVKTRNDAECAAFEHAAQVAASMKRPHPAIGRRLRIEFQERTPDGNYRHPRWDRWENE